MGTINVPNVPQSTAGASVRLPAHRRVDIAKPAGYTMIFTKHIKKRAKQQVILIEHGKDFIVDRAAAEGKMRGLN
jgi:hypothetical protein